MERYERSIMYSTLPSCKLEYIEFDNLTPRGRASVFIHRQE